MIGYDTHAVEPLLDVLSTVLPCMSDPGYRDSVAERAATQEKVLPYFRRLFDRAQRSQKASALEAALSDAGEWQPVPLHSPARAFFESYR